jgi:hypothetical protein
VVHFQHVRLFFQNFLLVSLIFIFTNPLLEFYFFSKNCWRAGGWVEKFFQDIKMFSGHKKRVKKIFPD